MEPEGKHRNSIMKQRILAVFGLVEIVLRCTLTMNDFQGLMMQLEGSDNGAGSLEAPSSDPESQSWSKSISGPFQQAQIWATSIITGFVVRPLKEGGSWLGYVSRSDPRGALPAWLVNRVTAQLAPRLVKQLQTAARRYPGWKALTDNPHYKPWRNPDQVPPYRISLDDCVDPDAPVVPEEPKAATSSSRLEVPQPRDERHSVEDIGDISSEFSVEVDEDVHELPHDTKRKGKFYRLVKSMKNRRKSVQEAKSADNLVQDRTMDEKHTRRRRASNSIDGSA
ncbi:START domain-containing protein 10 [Eumeta japonica]|uniref:START domain-containing protein 10 n=1 Tax=Eumeta variegata TaxID=151549 RepID=A0A4C1SBI4_EUMVA|nr:START domain-containing protein 10 [Eumeta japonica]